MAGPQQAPHLHLAELTASQFLDVWRHFDADGNGYIEGKELENFFQELESARKGAGVDSKNDNLGDKMKEFMHKYDKNADGKIEMAELAQILPTEENFLLCFRQHVGSSSEFMEAWRRYDTDRSGYIEANELKGFLSDLLKKANRPYDEPKLQEYTQTIVSGTSGLVLGPRLSWGRAVPTPGVSPPHSRWEGEEEEAMGDRVLLVSWQLRMFDMNGDGKLGLSEMSRLLPVQENFLLKFQGMKLSSEEFNAIFAFYDKDGSGFIDENELDALLKDLYEKNKKEMNIQQLTNYRKSIMNLSDGGKLYRKELEIVLCNEPPM
ncbi:hypothetical protein QYF61_002752 [Mycteria americana]|uniref:Calretinin n=1 Tax=Mycteria americana TaxID=33587 RepID=A0AAN7NLM0_MYCAM|nr:hypothetical protein QYF61_002752 [Mycteria americana]